MSNVSLRCRNSMQCIRFAVAERHMCTSVGATPAPSRAVRPAAAGEPPRRLSSFCLRTEPSLIAWGRAGRAPPRLSVASQRVGCSVQVGTARGGPSPRSYCQPRPVNGSSNSANLTGGRRASAIGWYFPACLPPSEYTPFPPMSSFFVLLVGH